MTLISKQEIQTDKRQGILKISSHTDELPPNIPKRQRNPPVQYNAQRSWPSQESQTLVAKPTLHVSNKIKLLAIE